LYRAALDHVIARIDDTMRPLAARVLVALADEGLSATPAAHMRPLLLAFLDQWLDVMLGRSGLQWQPSWSLLLTRAELEPPEGDAWLYRSTSALVLEPLAALVARVVGRREVGEECRILAVALLGQASAFRRQSDGQLRVLNWSTINDDQRNAIRDVLHRSIEAIVDSAMSKKNARPLE
jgi:HTH-type transcriptional dual regulator CecR, C-terminal domain